jgi:hypothetical protein
MTEPTSSRSDTSRLVRQEMLLSELRPIEDVIAAARQEVAKHRAAAIAAQKGGAADPEKQRDAELAADGIEELVQRFEAMQSEVSGVSKTADAALEEMHEALDSLQRQIQPAVDGYGALTGQRHDQALPRKA